MLGFLNRSWYLLLSVAFICGMLFFFIHNQWLIIHFVRGRTYQEKQGDPVQKKSITLHFWRNNSWKREDSEIIWSSDRAQNILYLANRWLSVLDEEGFHSQKITIQNVTLSSSGQEACISFDRYPFDKEHSVREKYFFIEGLLKTVRSQNIKIMSIYFLVHHKPLEDYHLDFSHPWPLESFQTRE